MQDIGKKMAKGAGWMVLVRIIERSIGLVSTLILARLLVPGDFGLVAMATALYGLLEIMGAFNFDLAIIQSQKAEWRHYDTAWTLEVIYGASSGIVLAVIAIPASLFLAEPRLESVIYVLALCALIQGLRNNGVVTFRKDLNFGKEFRLLVLPKLAAFCVTIPLAFTLRSYWALVAGIITSRIVGLFLSFVMHPYRPRFSLDGWRELMKFSGWMLINNVLTFLCTRGIDLVIGKVSGAKALGLYSVAYEVSNLPTSELVAPISRAVFPGYAKLASDEKLLREGYLNVLALTATLAIPAGTGIAVLAEPMVHVLLGSQWVDTVVLIQWLAVYGIVRACLSNTGSVYLALGRPKIITYLSVLTVATLLPLQYALTSNFGVVGAAWALLIVSVATAPVNLVLLRKLVGVRMTTLLRVVWRPVISSGVMALTLIAWQGAWHGGNRLVGLLVLVASGVVVYVTSTLALWWACRCPEGGERILLREAKHIKFISMRLAPRTPD